jgi:hypothetical protein
MCGVSNLWGNWSYITPIMVSCPIKTPEHVVQEAKACTWHGIYSEFSRQHLCKANSNCSPARLGGRGLGSLCLTAHMQEIFLLVPTYPFPNCAQFGSSQVILTVSSTSSLRYPVRLHVICAAEWCRVIHCLYADTALSRRRLKRHHCLISLPVRWSQRDYICNSRVLLKNQRIVHWMVLKIA